MDDRKLIENLGGPSRVAELLGLDKSKGGAQRVQNWMTRGIPPKVKLSRPDLFLPNFTVLALPNEVNSIANFNVAKPN